MRKLDHYFKLSFDAGYSPEGWLDVRPIMHAVDEIEPNLKWVCQNLKFTSSRLPVLDVETASKYPLVYHLGSRGLAGFADNVGQVIEGTFYGASSGSGSAEPAEHQCVLLAVLDVCDSTTCDVYLRAMQAERLRQRFRTGLIVRAVVEDVPAF